ncbi:unnamed protein product [Mytilus coruscus]|uniref:Uncharacterized protein n=1 Tax=Mytilus coruscus TaxID=42192 RepID=A0A6J8E7I3_MYTCO|nr:unnamed protein product [Mytilus coruscus]
MEETGLIGNQTLPKAITLSEINCASMTDRTLQKAIELTLNGNWYEDELKIVVRTWNSHKLRSMKNVMTPCGRPELLYNLPELCGADNYLYVVKEAEIAVCEQACTKTSIICDQNVFDLCIYEMEENNWTEAACASEGIDLYLLLRPIIRNLVL